MPQVLILSGYITLRLLLTGLATLSTSTSSYEPLETHDPTLNRLAVTMFQKVHLYLQTELTSSESEYQLLEQMNKVTSAKYKDLTQVATNVGKGIIELNEKCNLEFHVPLCTLFIYSYFQLKVSKCT